MSEQKLEQIRANDRVSFSVQTQGSGPPVLYLHGFGGLACVDFLNLLAAEHTVYAPEMPGVGESSGLHDLRDTWELVLAYQDLLDALGLEDVVVVGHSVGGMIAAELAANAPGSVRELVLVSPMGVFVETAPGRDPFALLPSEWCLLFADQESETAQRFADPEGTIDERVEILVDRATAAEAAAKFLFPLPDRGLARRLYRIRARTLIVAGELDTVVPVENVERFRTGISNAEVRAVADAAHMLPLERPELLAETVAGFLAGTAASGGERMVAHG
ncbi:MAG: alpha/beta fold hydrolase [Nitriliruptorales bacterium]|nr:alpha/beta fold hydrolase [Nitriliruptorales bacterium]